MNFVNLTPHAITIDGIGTIPPSGQTVRVGTIRTAMTGCAGVRITLQNLGQVEGLPAPKDGTVYIVSGMVLDAMKRQGESVSTRAGLDVFAPDTGPDAIRENGQIVAVRGLVC